MSMNSYGQWFKEAVIAAALFAMAGCMSIDESQWTTVSGSVRSQYGSHPAYLNLKEEGTFMGGKKYSVAVTIGNCEVGNAYEKLDAHVRRQANDPAWKGLLTIEDVQPPYSIMTFQKSSPASTTRGVFDRFDLIPVGSGVKLCIKSTMSPGLFARTDDIIRAYAGIIDDVSAAQHRNTASPVSLPSSLPVSAPQALSSSTETLEVDAELEKMISKFANGLQAKKIAKVAVLDVVDLHGQKSELGRSLEEKIQILLVENKVKVIDRNHIQAILDEQKMSRAGLCNPEDAKKFGQISGADALILGPISSRDDNYILMLKAISTETAEVVAGVKCTFSKPSDLEKMANTAVK